MTERSSAERQHRDQDAGARQHPQPPAAVLAGRARSVQGRSWRGAAPRAPPRTANSPGPAAASKTGGAGPHTAEAVAGDAAPPGGWMAPGRGALVLPCPIGQAGEFVAQTAVPGPGITSFTVRGGQGGYGHRRGEDAHPPTSHSPVPISPRPLGTAAGRVPPAAWGRGGPGGRRAGRRGARPPLQAGSCPAGTGRGLSDSRERGIDSAG